MIKIPVVLSEVTFIKGSTSVKNLPDNDEFIEFAVAGKSNVGKSSLLRLLFNNRKMVKVSRTPGRTREINFFRVDIKEGPSLVVADLPGYGYAKVPMSMREEWGTFITDYLQSRTMLKAVFLLFDARRDVSEDEYEFIEWLNLNNIKVFPVMTKVDQIPKTHWGKASIRISEACGMRPVMFSSLKPLGIDDIWRKVISLLNEESDGCS